MSNHYFITTPIYYVNAKPHIGHTYTTIAADVLARYYRMQGKKTFFSVGTDEHGVKIQKKAEENEEDPQEFVDKIAAQFQFTWDELNISFDKFIRTTEKSHKKAVQKALQYMYNKGDIYKGEYEGLYCEGCEQYKNESDLKDGKCPDHDETPKIVKEETYVFALSKFKDKLLKKIENDEYKIRPKERKNEILSFYKNQGLNDVSFSRQKVKWGIPLPWDKDHTTYVWADAFLNYLSALGWEGQGGQAPEFWPSNLQLMSKDILRVHATIWPAMLLSLDLDLPENFFVHGFFLVESRKMSKSLGNVISPYDLVEKYGVDGTRYLLMSATTFGHDGDINWSRFDEKFNADLANGLGNLVNRVVSMTVKAFSGKVPEIENVKETNKNLINFINKEIVPAYKDSFSGLAPDKSLEIVTKLLSYLDRDINKAEPWNLIKQGKTDNPEIKNYFYSWLESIRIIAWFAWPFMPDTSDKIWQRLGLKPEDEKEKDFQSGVSWGGLSKDLNVNKGEPLFPRIDTDKQNPNS